MTKVSQKDLISKNLWVGIGCTSGISADLLSVAMEQIEQNYQLPITAIAGIATIDIKAKEPGLLEFCHRYNFDLKPFTAEMLSTVTVPHPNMAIAKIVATPSVAEAAAILAASHRNLAVKLLVTKQIFRLPEQPGAVTIAVAKSL